MSQPVLWEQQTAIKTVSDIVPQLASWDKSDHPSQIRLQAYLKDVMEKLLPVLPSNDLPLFLHLDINVQQPLHLTKHHDLENYLTPLFSNKRLNPKRFVLVTARKFIGGASQLILGIAQPMLSSLTSWSNFTHTHQGTTQSKHWKESLFNALAASDPSPITTDTADVQIAFVCSSRRNWVNLWKPTGDCMGSILGIQNPNRPFAPNDDLIVDLKLHLTIDNSMKNNINISMWWRNSSTKV